MARCIRSKNCGATVWWCNALWVARGIAIVAVFAFLARPTDAEVIFSDDFNGTSLDETIWTQPEFNTFVGRTQLRPTGGSFPILVENGLARLQLDTFNSISTGTFLGSEIRTIQEFDNVDGLAYEARVRFDSAVPRGLIGSVFSFGSQGNRKDEIDWEILSNDLDDGTNRALTNVFLNEAGGAGNGQFISGVNLGVFNTFRVEWTTTDVKWFVNGLLVRTVSPPPSNYDQQVRLNFWAPDSNFADAFDATLQPTSDPGQNQTFFYEVDSVLVETLAAPPQCNNDGTCDAGEDCTTCPNDCISQTSGNPANQYCCGDGTCEGAEDGTNCAIDCGASPCNNNGICEAGEDCNNCGNDCESITGGNPASRHCCGNGIVEGPEGDSRCDGNP